MTKDGCKDCTIRALRISSTLHSTAKLTQSYYQNLGFFWVLQANHKQYSPKTVEEIMTYVQQSYQDYPRHRINHVWLPFMSVMNKMIDCHGNNNYNVQNIAKQRAERRNKLQMVLEVTDTALMYLGANFYKLLDICSLSTNPTRTNYFCTGWADLLL